MVRDNCVREASLWEVLEDQTVRCNLCSHHCRIGSGKRGLCGVRENREGILYSLVYGRVLARNVDPIEKKPLFHVAPGSLSYSVATAGCNFRCRHCQNYDISQAERYGDRLPGRFTSPDDVVDAAVRSDCRSIAYTYTEPTMFFEFALDCMKRATERGVINVFVTNGYQSPECIEAAAPYLDAANVDLKAYSDDFYRNICGARLQPVLDTIADLHRRGVWVEATTLIIPQHNDTPEELRKIAGFLAAVSPDLPWHVTGFYPTYQLTDVPPTPPAALQEARAIGVEEGLRHIYSGNRPGSGGEDTNCPSCGRVLIRRRGFVLTENALTGGEGCPQCGASVPGVEMGGST